MCRVLRREMTRQTSPPSAARPEISFSPTDEDVISVLLEKLTYLPLAIVQAASYMNMTQEPMKTYLELVGETRRRSGQASQ
jgi:hypothetical protein